MTREQQLETLKKMRNDVCEDSEDDQALCYAIRAIEALTEPIEQIKWECDTAIQQLKDLGYGLGEKPRTDGNAISRKEAIDAAKHAWAKGLEPSQYIEDLPSVHPKFPKNWWKTDHGYMWLCPHCGLPVHSDFEECLRCGIKRQSAKPEQKNGKWKRKIVDSGYNADWICSECGYRLKTDFVNYNFCPNCGSYNGGEQG